LRNKLYIGTKIGDLLLCVILTNLLNLGTNS